MRSIISTAFVALASLSAVLAEEPFDPKTNTGGQDPLHISDDLTLPSMTDMGCFSAPSEDMVDMGVYTFQSSGWCQPLCFRQSKQVMALVNGTNCFCGDNPPDSKYKLSSEKCKTKTCSGSSLAYCGGINAFSVIDDGYTIGAVTGSVKIVVPKQTYTFSGYASTSSTSSSKPTTMPATVVVTQSATATPTQTSAPPSSGSTNKAALAGGIVVAVVVVAGIAFGIWFFMRRKKQQALAEEQRRHEMLTNFVTAEKPTSGYTSPDSRLDPSLMFQRRMSDGSIRDDEDYSRRILKVANPDH